MRIVFDLPEEVTAEQAAAVMALLPYKVFDHGIFPAVCAYKGYTHYFNIDDTTRDKWQHETAHALAMMGATVVGVYLDAGNDNDNDNKYFYRGAAHAHYSHNMKHNLAFYRRKVHDDMTGAHVNPQRYV